MSLIVSFDFFRFTHKMVIPINNKNTTIETTIIYKKIVKKTAKFLILTKIKNNCEAKNVEGEATEGFSMLSIV